MHVNAVYDHTETVIDHLTPGQLFPEYLKTTRIEATPQFEKFRVHALYFTIKHDTIVSIWSDR
jgi:hypothetical protein